MKNILLINYDFPPNDGIGGRRWAKFAKYLSRNGWTIHVICSEFYGPQESLWTKDIQNKNIHLYQLPLNYPSVFLKNSGSLFDSLHYRILKKWYEIIQPKRIYDKAFLWEKQLGKVAEELIIKHDIKNVISSGAPFYLLYYTALFCKKFPDLNFIADYRDPWIGAVNYGMSSLHKKKLLFELALQNTVAENASYITAPNIFLLDKIKNSISGQTKAIYREISHAYDPEDLPQSSNPSPDDGKKIKFVYGGTLYQGVESTLKMLKTALDQVKKTNNAVYQKLYFEFYTSEVHFASLFKEHEACVSFSKPIGNKLFEKIAEAGYCLVILANHNKDYLTTKFYEYAAMKKPLIYLGEEGYVSEFIKKNKLGAVFHNDISILYDFLSSENALPDYDSTFPIENFSASKVVSDIEKMLVE